MDWYQEEAARLAAEVLSNTRTGDEAKAARDSIELTLRRLVQTTRAAVVIHGRDAASDVIANAVAVGMRGFTESGPRFELKEHVPDDWARALTEVLEVIDSHRDSIPVNDLTTERWYAALREKVEELGR